VSCYEDLVRLLDVGATARATGATSLNEHSSRSHAIFTIIVEQSILSSSSSGSGNRQHQQHQLRRPPSGAGSASSSDASSDACSGVGEEEAGLLRRSSNSGLVTGMVTPRTRLLQQLNKQTAGSGMGGSLDSSSEAPLGEGAAGAAAAAAGEEEAGSCSGSAGGGGGVLEYRCAKFHLVDLAGSERTKRSGVVGVRFREAVTINQVGGQPVQGGLSQKQQQYCTADILPWGVQYTHDRSLSHLVCTRTKVAHQIRQAGVGRP
jgi:hypothetical protein